MNVKLIAIDSGTPMFWGGTSNKKKAPDSISDWYGPFYLSDFFAFDVVRPLS